jgi:hypothetical protein
MHLPSVKIRVPAEKKTRRESPRANALAIAASRNTFSVDTIGFAAGGNCVGSGSDLGSDDEAYHNQTATPPPYTPNLGRSVGNHALTQKTPLDSVTLTV